MKTCRDITVLLLTLAAFACSGGGTAGNSGVSMLAGVTLSNSQQGQSGGMIDYDRAGFTFAQSDAA